MTPLQEIDIHTDQELFFKLHLISPTKTAPFFAEVIVYDSAFEPPYHSNVAFHKQFDEPEDAFAHALSWSQAYNNLRKASIERINNPCNCEFLEQHEQQQIVKAAGEKVSVEVNGS